MLNSFQDMETIELGTQRTFVSPLSSIVCHFYILLCIGKNIRGKREQKVCIYPYVLRLDHIMYVYVHVRKCRTFGVIGRVPTQFCELRLQFCDHVEVPNLCSEFGVMRGRSQSCELGGSDPVLLPETGFVTVSPSRSQAFVNQNILPSFPPDCGIQRQRLPWRWKGTQFQILWYSTGSKTSLWTSFLLDCVIHSVLASLIQYSAGSKTSFWTTNNLFSCDYAFPP